MKQIKTVTWKVKDLVDFIDNKEIYKPDFQRRHVWTVFPKENDTVPNYKSYIDFLYQNKNTINQLTFTEEIIDSQIKYKNLDGNNRMLAIYSFMKEPLLLYPELKEKFYQIANNFQFSGEKDRIIQQLADHIFGMSYNTIYSYQKLSHLRRSDRTIKKLTDYISADSREELDDWIGDVRVKISVGDANESFGNAVDVNVVLLKAYTIEEQVEIFENLNKYRANLSKTEILASILNNIKDIHINDKVLEQELKMLTQKYYSQKNEGEVVECVDISNKSNQQLNVFEILVSLQEYCSEKFEVISPFKTDGVSLFFKIYKFIYGKIDKSTLSRENINEFIDNIITASEELQTIMRKLIPEQLDKKVLNRQLNIKRIFSDNALYLLLVTLIFSKKNNLIVSIRKKMLYVIAYHLCVNSIQDSTQKKHFQINDILAYRAGGGYVDSITAKYARNNESIGDAVTAEEFKELITYLMDQHNVITAYSDKPKRNNNLPVLYNLMIINYFNTATPNCYLHDDSFHLEHIVPYSSKWEGEINIHRLGNLVPIFGKLNQGRSNKSIEYYFTDEKCQEKEITKFIKMIPNVDIYHTFVQHPPTKKEYPSVTNNQLYNEFCQKNENTYIEIFIKSLF